jgi:uncharacterized protein (DUF302 family)
LRVHGQAVTEDLLDHGCLTAVGDADCSGSDGTATIGAPEISDFRRTIASARTSADFEATVQRAIGVSGLMEFIRFDAGAILRKEQGATEPKILRLVVGNPIIMKEMVRRVPDAASYAPVTILIDERIDGVHLSYDSLESLIAPYGNREAEIVARDLDRKIELLLANAAT